MMRSSERFYLGSGRRACIYTVLIAKNEKLTLKSAKQMEAFVLRNEPKDLVRCHYEECRKGQIKRNRGENIHIRYSRLRETEIVYHIVRPLAIYNHLSFSAG
jgi:hypothetical protein